MTARLPRRRRSPRAPHRAAGSRLRHHGALGDRGRLPRRVPRRSSASSRHPDLGRARRRRARRPVHGVPRRVHGRAARRRRLPGLDGGAADRPQLPPCRRGIRIPPPPDPGAPRSGRACSPTCSTPRSPRSTSACCPRWCRRALRPRSPWRLLVLCHVVLGVVWLGICTIAVAGGRSVLGAPRRAAVARPGDRGRAARLRDPAGARRDLTPAVFGAIGRPGRACGTTAMGAVSGSASLAWRPRRRPTCPSWISRMRSACAAIRGSCVETIAATPRWCTSAAIRDIIASALVLSSWPVGSSAISRRGSLARARAMPSRCCCPPESSPGR